MSGVHAVPRELWFPQFCHWGAEKSAGEDTPTENRYQEYQEEIADKAGTATAEESEVLCEYRGFRDVDGHGPEVIVDDHQLG